MAEIFAITLPVYLIIVIGYIAVRLKYVGDAAVAGLGQFTIKVSLPTLIFSAIAFSTSEAALNWPLIAGYFLASLAVLGTGFGIMRGLFNEGAGASWIHGLGFSSSNSGFIGYSVALIVFPETALSTLAWIMIVENVAIIPIAIVAAELSGSQSGNVRHAVAKAWRSFSRNPLVIAVVLGLLVRLSGIGVPERIETTIQMVASVAPVIALFVVGGIIARYELRPYWRRTSAISFGKLVLHPLVVFLVLAALIGARDPYVLTAVLIASVPMLTIYPILGAPYGAERLCATALVMTTVASFFTVNAMIWLLQP